MCPVESAGARRGLALRTRQTYGLWAARFGVFAQTARRSMDPGVARDFLVHLVNERRCSYATQRHALNGLVFFFREVCEMKDVDLKVKLRKTPPKEPVVLDVEELLALIGKLHGVRPSCNAARACGARNWSACGSRTSI